MRASTICLRLGVAALLAACSSAKPPPPARPAPTPTPPAPAITAPPTSTIIRLAAGGVPGSNTHRWGSRFYELRNAGGGIEFRMHDAIDFQGSGMQPKDMPPTQHTCSRWELVPSSILATLPSGTRCGDAGATCNDLDRWLKATRPPVPPRLRTTSSSRTTRRSGAA
jgi:hypothetical protein